MTDIGRLRELLAEATEASWCTVANWESGDGIFIESGSHPDVVAVALVYPTYSPEAKSQNAELIVELRNAAPHLLSEIETLRAELALAERVVEAARTYIMLEWETLDLAALSVKRRDHGFDAIPYAEIALSESIAAYDQGKVTICDSALAPTTEKKSP